MATWDEVTSAVPELAARVQQRFDAGRHKTIATLRADGSPRISGIECEFDNGELRFGSMASSRKGADMRRDPRVALHSPSVDPVEGSEAEWPGEAKVSGRAVPAGRLEPGDDASPDQPTPDGDAFTLDIDEVVLTRLDDGATMLVIESWTPQRGYRRVERA